MLKIRINREEFEYDIYALVTSFFPDPEVKVEIAGDKSGAECESDTALFLLEPDAGRGTICFKGGKCLPADWEYCFEYTESADPGDFRKAWKLFLYDSLCEYSGITLPWGALTGVRPTKLIMRMINDGTGRDRDEIIKELYDTCRVSEDKARLGIRIAELEDGILKPFTDGKGYSLYIGIPFCPSTCLYCSFTSFPIAKFEKKVDDYLDALADEMRATCEYMQGKRLDTVYIGGGTPTSLDEVRLEKLLHSITSIMPMENVKEFTVEAGRPDSITTGKLAAMKKYGVTRISVNPQTMKDETLKLIGRHHTTDDIRRAFAQAREAGFDNINMDLILGLPGETLSDVEHTFDAVAEFKPDSITAHSLAIKRASRMKQWIAEHGAISGLDAEKAMQKAYDTADDLGMKPYYLYRQKNMAGSLENTGFAHEGKYGLYNILIMEEVQSIVALGVGTVSKRVHCDDTGLIERCDTHKDVNLYLSDLQAMIERKRKLFGAGE